MNSLNMQLYNIKALRSSTRNKEMAKCKPKMST